MSWAPPHLAKPNCAQCANGRHSGITVAIRDQPAFALRECALHDERRYWFRKNPPMPDMENGGASVFAHGILEETKAEPEKPSLIDRILGRVVPA